MNCSRKDVSTQGTMRFWFTKFLIALFFLSVLLIATQSTSYAWPPVATSISFETEYAWGPSTAWGEKWYKFTISSSWEIGIDLVVPYVSGAENRYDLELYNSDANDPWLDGSYESYGYDENITKTLTSGTYYIKVYTPQAITDGTNNMSRLTVSFAPLNSPPTIPGTLSASNVTCSSARVSWGASSDPDGDSITYYVEYKKDISTWTFGTLGSYTTTSTYKDLSNLESDTNYDVRVRAYDGEEYSNWRDQENVIVTPPCNSPPTPPGTLSASNVTCSSARVSWGASSDPDGDSITYYVEYKKDISTWTFGTLGSYTTTSTYKDLSNLESDTNYDVRVRAYDGEEYSNWRDQKNVIETEPLKPDLLIQNVWTEPSNPVAGYPVTIFTQIYNQDASDAEAFDVTYYVDGSSVGTNRVNSGLNPESTYDDSITCYSLNDAKTYLLRIVADSNSEVTETNEDNNEYNGLIDVQPPDMIEYLFGKPSDENRYAGVVDLFGKKYTIYNLHKLESQTDEIIQLPFCDKSGDCTGNDPPAIEKNFITDPGLAKLILETWKFEEQMINLQDEIDQVLEEIRDHYALDSMWRAGAETIIPGLKLFSKRKVVRINIGHMSLWSANEVFKAKMTGGGSLLGTTWSSIKNLHDLGKFDHYPSEVLRNEIQALLLAQSVWGGRLDILEDLLIKAQIPNLSILTKFIDGCLFFKNFNEDFMGAAEFLSSAQLAAEAGNVEQYVQHADAFASKIESIGIGLAIDIGEDWVFNRVLGWNSLDEEIQIAAWLSDAHCEGISVVSKDLIDVANRIILIKDGSDTPENKAILSKDYNRFLYGEGHILWPLVTEHFAVQLAHLQRIRDNTDPVTSWWVGASQSNIDELRQDNKDAYDYYYKKYLAKYEGYLIGVNNALAAYNGAFKAISQQRSNNLLDAYTRDDNRVYVGETIRLNINCQNRYASQITITDVGSGSGCDGIVFTGGGETTINSDEIKSIFIDVSVPDSWFTNGNCESVVDLCVLISWTIDSEAFSKKFAIPVIVSSKGNFDGIVADRNLFRPREIANVTCTYSGNVGTGNHIVVGSLLKPDGEKHGLSFDSQAEGSAQLSYELSDGPYGAYGVQAFLYEYLGEIIIPHTIVNHIFHLVPHVRGDLSIIDRNDLMVIYAKADVEAAQDIQEVFEIPNSSLIEIESHSYIELEGIAISHDTVLVGGNLANPLVEELVQQGRISVSLVNNGDALIEVVEGAFGTKDCVVVAGYGLLDTQVASIGLLDTWKNIPIIMPITDHATLELEAASYTGPMPSLSQGSFLVTWSLVEAPSGMAIDTDTGVVLWANPEVSGSPYTITIRATNTAGYDDESWQLTVDFNVILPVINPIADNSTSEGATYTGPTPSLSQGTLPVSWSLEVIPSDMTIDPNTGVVSWSNPITDGNPYLITIRAINDAGSDTESWQVTVIPNVIAPVIDPISDHTTLEDTPYTGSTPSLLQGTLPVTWSLVSGPIGMMIDIDTGVVSWPNPTVDGSPYTITIRAENDAGSDTESWQLMVTIIPIEPDIRIVPLPIDFGTVSMGSSGRETVTIYNDGACDLIIEEISITGTDAGEFQLVGLSSFAIPPHSSRLFDVSFVPTSVENKSATVCISSNDPDENPLCCQLTGTGGMIPCFDNSCCAPDFYCAKPEGSCNSEGVCTPIPEICPSLYDPICGCDGKTYANQCNAALSGISIAYRGECGTPEINLKQGKEEIPDNTGTFDFSNVCLGSDKAVTFTIENLGSGVLDLTETPIVNITGVNVSDFIVTQQPSANIQAGESISFVITFTPIMSGLRSAEVSINNNDSDESPYNFAITGTGCTDMKGDVDNSGSLDLADAILSLQVVCGIACDNVNSEADVDNNGKIGLPEAIYALQGVAGLRSAQSSNIPPHSTINSPVSSATFNIGQVVDFEGSGSDTDGQVVSYKWSFGDESVDWGQTISHTYNRPGSYTVTLIVTDDNGATGVDSITVDVETIWYKDADGDGYSDGTTQNSVSRPSSEYYELSELTATSGDLADSDGDTYPGATEICGDGKDNNCNGEIDEGCGTDVAWENGFTISEVASFPVGLSDHTCSRIGDKIYVMGGRKTLDSDGFGTDEMYEFNPNNNQLNLLGNTLPYSMLWGMSSAVAGNGKIYLGPAGGPELRNGWGTHSKIVEYDTSTGIAVENQAGYGTNMWGVSMTADSNGFIYLFGGHNGSDQNTIYKYDHNSDTMHLVSNLSYNTTGGTAILGANGKIYYFDVGRPGHKITLFDPSNNATSDVATIPSGFSFVGGAGKAGWADGENIYLLLVDDNENVLRLFKFNTQTNEVTDTTQTIPLSISRYSVVKHNDSVYIIGGTDFVNNVISNKIYKLSFSETMSKNLLYLKSTITMIQGESGSQYQEIKSWEQAGYSVTTATFDTTTIDSLLLSNYEVLRINDYWNHDFTSSEGDAIYNWVITGGKLLTDVGWEATVPLVSNFGVESIGVHIWQDYPFHGAPLTFGPVSGPVGSVSKIAVEAIGYPALALDHSLIVDTTYQGYPVVAHGEFGSGKVVLVLTAAGWSHDATFPGNAYQANIHQENNLEFLDNVIQYLDTN